MPARCVLWSRRVAARLAGQRLLSLSFYFRPRSNTRSTIDFKHSKARCSRSSCYKTGSACISGHPTVTGMNGIPSAITCPSSCCTSLSASSANSWFARGSLSRVVGSSTRARNVYRVLEGSFALVWHARDAGCSVRRSDKLDNCA